MSDLKYMRSLKTCPCGRKPELYLTRRNGTKLWNIRCSSDDCPLYRQPFADESIEFVQAIWDDRITYDDRHHRILSRMLGEINRNLARLLEIGGGER